MLYLLPPLIDEEGVAVFGFTKSFVQWVAENLTKHLTGIPLLDVVVSGQIGRTRE